jgi:hypothetical protein
MNGWKKMTIFSTEIQLKRHLAAPHYQQICIKKIISQRMGFQLFSAKINRKLRVTTKIGSNFFKQKLQGKEYHHALYLNLETLAGL